MRTYLRNSPEAALRVAALALLADGHLCTSELRALKACGARAWLPLDDARVDRVLQDLCEDLMATRDQPWGSGELLDAASLAAVMAEVDAPALRRTVLAMCHAVVQADSAVSERERLLLRTLASAWQMPAWAEVPAATARNGVAIVVEAPSLPARSPGILAAVRRLRALFDGVAHRVRRIVVRIAPTAPAEGRQPRHCQVEVHMADGHVVRVEDRHRRLDTLMRRAAHTAWQSALRWVMRMRRARSLLHLREHPAPAPVRTAPLPARQRVLRPQRSG